MKTSNKILIAYVAVTFVFYIVAGILNVVRTRQTMPLAEDLCRQFDRTPVRVIDLRAATGYYVNGSDSGNQLQLASLEPGALTFRGDTLVVQGEGGFPGTFGKQFKSRIFLSTLVTMIDADGTHAYHTKAARQSDSGKADAADSAGPSEAASAETSRPEATSPNP